MIRNNVSKFAHPGLAFFVFSTLAVLVWLAMPQEVFARWNIPVRSSFVPVAVAWVASSVVFLLGWAAEIVFARHRCAPASASADRRSARTVVWTIALVSTAAFVLLTAMVFATHGAAGLANPKIYRDGGIGGITTLVLLAPCPLVIWFALRLKRVRLRGFGIPVVLSTAVMTAHVHLASARLSLLLAVIACAVIYWVHRMQTGRRLPWSAVIATSVAVVVVFAFFEYFRTFRSKQEHGFETGGAAGYGLERLGMYVATAVNNGGVLYRSRMADEYSRPVFTQTAGPVGEVLYGAAGLEPFYAVPNPGGGILAELEANREFNPEFNNCWGLAGPWLEGPVSGVAFFFVWGAMASWSFRRMRARTGVYELLIYGYVYGGIVDTSMRVASLGSSYLMLPIAVMAVVSLVQRRARTAPSESRESGAYRTARAGHAGSAG
jgi:hypothetical protein